MVNAPAPVTASVRLPQSVDVPDFYMQSIPRRLLFHKYMYVCSSLHAVPDLGMGPDVAVTRGLHDQGSGLNVFRKKCTKTLFIVINVFENNKIGPTR